MTDVLAPCSGRVLALADVNDPVFAAEMVGPGAAIEPAPVAETVIAPVAGTIVKLHPHAFAMSTAEGFAILVHLGINTVRLGGEGFELLVAEGAEVAAGDELIRWNPGELSGENLYSTVMVVVLDRAGGSLGSPLVGQDVARGSVLFSVDG